MGSFDMGPAGGGGGSAYRDDVGPVGRITRVIVRHGEVIDAIQMEVDNGGIHQVRARHGGTGGTEDHFDLAADEYITAMTGKTGKVVDHIVLYTNKAKQYSYGGSGGTAEFTFQLPPNFEACGFFGKSGEDLDSIGLIYRQRP